MKKARRKNRIHPDTILLLKQIGVGVLIFSALALLITAIWYGTRVTALTIDTVDVSGGETIDHEVIRGKVQAELEGTYLKVIPRTFSLLYPRDAIFAALAGVERVKDIQISRVGFKKIHVSFEEYISEALWCKTDSEACLFVDKDGFAFSKAPVLKGGAFIRYVTIGREPVLGQSIVSREDYANLGSLLAQLELNGWPIYKVDVDAAADAYLQIVDGGEFKISLKQPADDTISNLNTILGSDDFKELTPGNFQYIDLRFGNKVFVNDSAEEILEELSEVDGVQTLEPTASTTPERPVIEELENEPQAAVTTPASSTSQE